MFGIADDNDLSTGLDCRCQHVPVGWIREFESLDKVRSFVSGDEAVPDRQVSGRAAQLDQSGEPRA